MIQPTIGIEIELPWPTMVRRVDPEAADILQQSRGFYSLSEQEQARVQTGFDALDMLMKDTVKAAFNEDIARGKDGYAEFALRPKSEARELVAVTSQLYDTGILQPGELYPLHITLGNVPLMKQSWLILTCLELTGGTSPDRLLQTKTWARKGVAGILKREPHELQLGSTLGFEMRTLQLSSLEGLSRQLELAQHLARLALGKVQGDDLRTNQWRELFRFMKHEAGQKGIDINYAWPNPQDDMTPWELSATALRESIWVRSMQERLDDLLDIR